jgi:hypothetical protein
VNAQQPGFWAGVLLGGGAAGAIAGLVPLFFGVRRGQTGLAVGGFLASVAGGLATGIIGASVLAGIFSLATRPWDEPSTDAMQTPPGSASGGSRAAWYLVVMFFVQTIFMAAFWSLFMSFWMGRRFFEILIPAGAAFGLTMGVFLTAFMAVLLRPSSVRMPVLDRTEFLDRLDRAAAKLGFKRVEKTEGTVAYVPRSVLRVGAIPILVGLGGDEAIITGPHVTLNSLKKTMETC